MNIKRIVVAQLLLVFGFAGAPAHAQRPSGRPPRKAPSAAAQTTEPNTAASQNAAQDAEPNVVQLLPQNLPQDEIRSAIHDAIQKAMVDARLQAKPNLVAIQAMQNALGNHAPSASQNVVPSGVSNTATLVSADVTPSADANHASQPRRVPGVAPESQAGITALQNAQSNLLSAGQKWGGHKMKAAVFINQALVACGQPKVPIQEATAASVDQSAAMQAALTQLTNAKSVFANASTACRDQAIALISQALSEIQAGIDFSKSHNTF